MSAGRQCSLVSGILRSMTINRATDFHSPSHGPLALLGVIDRIHGYVDEVAALQHKVIIGTDSSPAQGGLAEFVTALVVHRVGRGGIYFWRTAKKAAIHTLRDRMYHEALLSLELAQTLVSGGLLRPELMTNDFMEIHIDIGENGPTRAMIKEIVGMVHGSGFTVRTKPASFAASKVADRYT